MQQAQFFHEIAKHRRLIGKHHSLLQLLSAVFEVTDNQQQISNLQKEFIITEFGFSYCHFGYSLFANSALDLMKKGYLQQCAVETSFIEKYVLNLKEYLSEEIKFDKKDIYFSNEILESLFAKEIVKRIFSTEKIEDIYTGMFAFDQFYIEKVRNLSRSKMEEFTPKINTQIKISNLMEEKKILYFDIIYNEFFSFLEKFKLNPLNLIMGRFESFINFFKNDVNSVFILRENNKFSEENSKKMTGILTLLVPHKHHSGAVLAKNTMLTVNQIVKLLSVKFRSEYFNLSPIKNWLGDYESDAMNEKIEFLLEEAVKCGVVFKVPQGNKAYCYGLNENGLKIIEPYHAILTESLVINNNIENYATVGQV